MMVDIKTESGFACRIDPDKIGDNYELLELLTQLDDGKVFVLPKVLELVLEEPKQIQAMKDHVRDKEGKVSTVAMHRELLEIFRSQRKLKN